MYSPRTRERHREIEWKQVDIRQKYHEHVQMAACRDSGGILFAEKRQSLIPSRKWERSEIRKGKAINFYERKLSPIRRCACEQRCRTFAYIADLANTRKQFHRTLSLLGKIAVRCEIGAKYKRENGKPISTD